MPRQMRMEYPGAIYLFLSRGDLRQPIADGQPEERGSQTSRLVESPSLNTNQHTFSALLAHI
jgi:hypothetical protein